MKIEFTLGNGLSGIEIASRFREAILEEGVGFDADHYSKAVLSEDGLTWTTAWSSFKYKILNPHSDEEAAIIEYDGPWRGFLSQNLIPEELRSETLLAKITEGSALKKHQSEAFWHTNASHLAEAYGLLQFLPHRPWDGENYKPVIAALTALRSAKVIENHLRHLGVNGIGDNTYVVAWTNTGGHAASHIEDGDPAIFVTCCPGGEQVTKEFKFPRWGWQDQDDPESPTQEAIRWIDRIKTVL